VAGVDKVDDAHARLVGMLPVQAAGVLLKGALPGNRHGQHERVERRMVEAFADQLAGGKQHTRGARRAGERPTRSPTHFVVQAFDSIRRKSEMKLDRLDAATKISDLDLPGNRLERLKGDRKGQYSIRINDQWRICFEWPTGSPGPANVEIVDYH
jgi:proteic killer suppression protein